VLEGRTAGMRARWARVYPGSRSGHYTSTHASSPLHRGRRGRGAVTCGDAMQEQQPEAAAVGPQWAHRQAATGPHLKQPLHNGERKGQRLAAAGLGAPNEVAALHDGVKHCLRGGVCVCACACACSCIRLGCEGGECVRAGVPPSRHPCVPPPHPPSGWGTAT